MKMPLYYGIIMICGLHITMSQVPRRPAGGGGGLVVDFGAGGFFDSPNFDTNTNPFDPRNAGANSNSNPTEPFTAVTNAGTNVDLTQPMNTQTNVPTNSNRNEVLNAGTNVNTGSTFSTNILPGSSNNANRNQARTTVTNTNFGTNVATNTNTNTEFTAFERRQGQNSNMVMESRSVVDNMPIHRTPSLVDRTNNVGGMVVGQPNLPANQGLQGQQNFNVGSSGKTGGGRPTAGGNPINFLNENRIDTKQQRPDINPGINTIQSNQPPVQFVDPAQPGGIDNTIASNVNIQVPQNTNSIASNVNIQVPQNTGPINIQNLQEFNQQQQTAFDNIPNNANNINSNLNAAVGFGTTNEIYPNPANPILQLEDKCAIADLKPVYKIINGHKILNPLQFILGGFKMTCPRGTGYSLVTCSCDSMSEEILLAKLQKLGYSGSACIPDINLDFNNGLLYDEQLTHWSVNSQGIKPARGVAIFNGNPKSSFVIPKYNRNQRKMIAFSFKFKSDAPHRDHPHPLITNCKSSYSSDPTRDMEPTYGVILNSNSNYTTFFVKVERPFKRGKLNNRKPGVRTKFVTLPVNPSIWNTVKYSFDGRRLRAEVNGQRDRVAAIGLIPIEGNNPISVGHCLRYGNFVGEIDDVRIYSRCLPKNW